MQKNRTLTYKKISPFVGEPVYVVMKNGTRYIGVASRVTQQKLYLNEHEQRAKRQHSAKDKAALMGNMKEAAMMHPFSLAAPETLNIDEIVFVFLPNYF